MHLHFIKKAKEKEKEAIKLIKKQSKKLESYLFKKKTINSESKLENYIEDIKQTGKFENLDLDKIKAIFEKVAKSSHDKDSKDENDDTSSESGQIKKKKSKKKKKNKKKKRSSSTSETKHKKEDKIELDLEKEDGEASLD